MSRWEGGGAGSESDRVFAWHISTGVWFSDQWSTVTMCGEGVVCDGANNRGRNAPKVRIAPHKWRIACKAVAHRIKTPLNAVFMLAGADPSYFYNLIINTEDKYLLRLVCSHGDTLMVLPSVHTFWKLLMTCESHILFDKMVIFVKMTTVIEFSHIIQSILP